MVEACYINATMNLQRKMNGGWTEDAASYTWPPLSKNRMKKQ